VSERVSSWYRTKGYPTTTYERLADEAYDIYLIKCAGSGDGTPELVVFCDGVAENAGNFFSDPQAGRQLWLTDCQAGQFYAG
jgi:hypothetical protein